MSSVNKAILLGRLGADPEIRTTQSGSRCANMSIATGEKWRDKNTGEQREKTEWHRVTVWSEGLVGVVEKYLHKGSQVYVEGQLQTRKWQDQSGQDRYTTEVVLQGFGGKIVLLGDSGGERTPAAQPNPAPIPGPGDHDYADLDDEVPF